MLDQDQVIKGLDELEDYFYQIYRDSDDREEYSIAYDRMEVVECARDILKEHEPAKVKDCADIVDGIQIGYCPKCDRKIVWNPEKEETVAFCKYCGQSVEWDGGEVNEQTI